MVFRDFCPFLGTPPGGPKNEKNTHLGMIFLVPDQENQKNCDFSDFPEKWPSGHFSGGRSWEGLTARGGLDGPHLGHPLRRDQVHVC